MRRDADLPSGTVTFLFSDIEGSTRLLQRIPEAYGAVLEDHQRLLRDAFAEADGREIDTMVTLSSSPSRGRRTR